MSINLEPYYPGKPTLDEQLDYIKSEYEEVLEAVEEENWEEVCKELLDLKQTIVGYYEIKYPNKWRLIIMSNKFEPAFDISIETLQYFWSYYDDQKMRDRFNVSLAELYWIADVNFKRIIKEHDRGNSKYRRELTKRLLDEHYEKLEKRKKEWAGCDKVEG